MGQRLIGLSGEYIVVLIASNNIFLFEPFSLLKYIHCCVC